MNYFFLIIGILIILDIIYFSFVNQGQTLTINYKPLIDEINIESGLFFFLLGIYGLLGGILITYSKIINLKKEIKKICMKSEKTSIESEENTDKVKVLESKIKTLEMALKEALKKT